jgi:hypothetical protein
MASRTRASRTRASGPAALKSVKILFIERVLSVEQVDPGQSFFALVLRAVRLIFDRRHVEIRARTDKRRLPDGSEQSPISLITPASLPLHDGCVENALTVGITRGINRSDDTTAFRQFWLPSCLLNIARAYKDL